MAENIIGQGLTTLYRGQPMLGESRYLKMLNQGLPSPGSNLGLNKKDLSKLAGQYYSKSLGTAKSYAGPFGKIKSMNVPSDYLNKFNRFQTSVTNLPSGKFTQAGAGGGSNYLVPKSAIKTFNPSINYGQTIKNIASSNNPFAKLMDEAKTIKAGYDLYGPGYALKDLGSEGLGFLRNNALRALTIAGTLPAQAGLMTLTPTRIGNAELPQMPQGSPRRINMLPQMPQGSPRMINRNNGGGEGGRNDGGAGDRASNSGGTGGRRGGAGRFR